MRARIGVISTALIMALLAACAFSDRQTPAFHYYTLSYKLPPLGKQYTVKESIKIWPVRTYKPYDSNKIIYRTSPYQFEPTVYHIWAAKPGEMLRELLARDLADRGGFQHVYGPYETQSSNYDLVLTLQEFDCRTYGDRPRAVIRVSAILNRRERTNAEPAVIMRKTYEANVVCNTTEPQALASAMSRGMKNISLNLIGDIHNAISKSRPASKSNRRR